MHIVSDLHLHSKYSQAVSKFMTISTMHEMSLQKGLQLIGTGDFTHPFWLKELQRDLEEGEEGVFKLKNNVSSTTRFMLTVEISCIYTQAGKGRRIHNLVFAPSFIVVEKINQELVRRGCNLSSDGRPIIGLSSKELLELILAIDERCLLIPAHIWTPWFGIYGMRSGFNSLEECFGDMNKFVYAIETGLSSDPEMNWQIKELDTRSILSFSDAHSPVKMGREATVFAVESLSYEHIRKAIMQPSKKEKSNNNVAYTIEFYPEEGKYHYSGHRNCHVIMNPEEQRVSKGVCAVCGKNVTDGVMRRVQELSDQAMPILIDEDRKEIKWIKDAQQIHPPFVKLVPLLEIIAECVGTKVGSKKAEALFTLLCDQVGSELDILLRIPLEKIAKTGGPKIAEGIQKIRMGILNIKPGYDGLYGIVSIWSKENSLKQSGQENTPQLKIEL